MGWYGLNTGGGWNGPKGALLLIVEIKQISKNYKLDKNNFYSKQDNNFCTFGTQVDGKTEKSKPKQTENW